MSEDTGPADTQSVDTGSVDDAPEACRPPSARELRGRSVVLEPLVHPVAAAEVVDGLYAIMSDPEAFGSGYPFEVPHADRAETEAFVAGRLALDGQGYVVRAVDPALAGPGTVIGTTSLMDVDLRNEKVHLGTTFYGRRWWGGVVNAESKLLVLGHAFEDCGFGRVRIQCDARNERSRSAITRLGARFEGVLRRDVRRADDSWRDTVVYAILADDWPACRTALEERLRASRAAGGGVAQPPT